MFVVCGQKFGRSLPTFRRKTSRQARNRQQLDRSWTLMIETMRFAETSMGVHLKYAVFITSEVVVFEIQSVVSMNFRLRRG